MSRTRTRARQRAHRAEQNNQAARLAEFDRARHDPAAFESHLKLLAASTEVVWPLAEASGQVWPLTDDERAMIAQVVAPSLAGTKPRSVKLRIASDRAGTHR